MDLSKWLEIASHWPDLSCMVAGGTVGYFVTLATERYWLPEATTPDAARRQQGLTFALCVAVSAVTSALLWWGWDPIDHWAVRAVSSFAAAVITTTLYPVLARFLTSKWPALGSAWGLK